MVRRLLPAAQAALGRALRLLRPLRAGDRAPGVRARRAAASAHRPGDRHLPVRGRDDASRQPRQRAGDRARRDQLDDRRARHRAFGAQARAPARRDLREPRPAAVGRLAAGARRGRAELRAHAGRRDIPALEVQGAQVRVLVGEAFGVRSPVRDAFADVYLDWRCRPARASSCRRWRRSWRSIRSTATSRSTASRVAQHTMAVLADGAGRRADAAGAGARWW